MDMREFQIRDAFEIIPAQHRDERGVYLEWYRGDAWERLGVDDLTLRRANISVSREGVLRGLHVTSVPPGQAKYVSCVYGRVMDVVVELRKAVYLREGLAHGLLSLSDHVNDPKTEITIDPFDPTLAIQWTDGTSALPSSKDRNGRSLEECSRAAVLPKYADATATDRVARVVSKPPTNPKGLPSNSEL